MKKFSAVIGFMAICGGAFAEIQSCTQNECTMTETTSWKVDVKAKIEEKNAVKAQIEALQARLTKIKAELQAMRSAGAGVSEEQAQASGYAGE